MTVLQMIFSTGVRSKWESYGRRGVKEPFLGLQTDERCFKGAFLHSLKI
jgi:hypothetical protein